MRVKELLREKGTELIGIYSDTRISQAIEKMVERNIGAVIVVDGNTPIGLFTERDVLKAWVKYGKDFSDIPVSNVMSRDMVVVQPEDDIQYAMSVMNSKKIRHLPVVEKEGKIIGIISIRDVVRALVGKLEAEVHYLKEYITESK